MGDDARSGPNRLGETVDRLLADERDNKSRISRFAIFLARRRETGCRNPAVRAAKDEDRRVRLADARQARGLGAVGRRAEVLSPGRLVSEGSDAKRGSGTKWFEPSDQEADEDVHPSVIGGGCDRSGAVNRLRESRSPAR